MQGSGDAEILFDRKGVAPQRVVVKTDATTEVRLKPSEIKLRRRSRLSMMPEDLMNYMTDQQLVDVVQYLTTLKEDRRASR